MRKNHQPIDRPTGIGIPVRTLLFREGCSVNLKNPGGGGGCSSPATTQSHGLSQMVSEHPERRKQRGEPPKSKLNSILGQCAGRQNMKQPEGSMAPPFPPLHPLPHAPFGDSCRPAMDNPVT